MLAVGESGTSGGDAQAGTIAADNQTTASGSIISINTTKTDSFLIKGSSSHFYSGRSVSGAGDVIIKRANTPVVSIAMSITTTSGARIAIGKINTAITTVNTQRSELGAVFNRLSHIVNNLTNISSNLSTAKDGIKDPNFAVETMQRPKNQILQQASTAMLAQANTSKQNMLSLLQGSVKSALQIV